MSGFRMICRAFRRLFTWVKRAWNVHQERMSSDHRYAGAFVEGVVLALWQRTVKWVIVAIVEMALNLYKVIRLDTVPVGDGLAT